MSLAKLTISYERGKVGALPGVIVAGFNPSQLSYQKTLSWERVEPAASKTHPSGTLQHRSTSPETLTVELFFDAYAAGEGGPLGPFAPRAANVGVVGMTDQVARLAQFDAELHRPPVCTIAWGKQTLFRGVLQQLSRTFLLFLEDGTPVRASLNCTFLEAEGEVSAARELHSADVAKTYVVRPGDTLAGIAASAYGDASQWRRIAEANRIDDPRRLAPGRTLSIPRLR
jgi:nucleoid-associated protein YgaU